MRFRIQTTVKSVEHRRVLVSTRPTGRREPDGKPEFVSEWEEQGWFVHLEGSREAIYLGEEDPGLRVGQAMDVILVPR